MSNDSGGRASCPFGLYCYPAVFGGETVVITRQALKPVLHAQQRRLPLIPAFAFAPAAFSMPIEAVLRAFMALLHTMESVRSLLEEELQERRLLQEGSGQIPWCAGEP